MPDINKIIQDRIENIRKFVNFEGEYNNSDNVCFTRAVNNKYKELRENDDQRSFTERVVDGGTDIRGSFDDWDPTQHYQGAAVLVYNQEFEFAKQSLDTCLRRQNAEQIKAENDKKTVPSDFERDYDDEEGPFDKRLYREFFTTDNESINKIPFSTQYKCTATTGLFVAEKYYKENWSPPPSGVKAPGKEEGWQQIQAARKDLQKDTMYIGVPALQNTYALTKLYGSEGGKKLLNKRGDRRWYEVDQAIGLGSNDLANFSSNPTTSSLISWGGGDPYGRTPYHFTDFAFAKYWNKIENNRLITLRRFGGPILDNLKFPGMDGIKEKWNSEAIDTGSTSKLLFPPMAHAITYFGEETGNKLSELLKFTTGVKWDELKSDVWNVGTQATPENTSGPGMFGALANLSKMLAVAGGNYDPQLVMNKGQLPPDPYSDGPYENRILGPVNRIDTVKRRVAGLEFDWSGLNLVFEYVARPIGGVNPKAVLLDILSNFLIIGSASAVFFGGQHRFMGNPARYPFLGGAEGIESWYSGEPIEWAGHTIKQFAGQVTNKEGGLLKRALDVFTQLLGGGGKGGLEAIFGNVAGLFTGDGLVKDILTHKLAEKSAGQVPYLTGMRALLIGEPVGEWHVTIGNPLNPIAMIGNLICTGIEIEFGEELGPDDFPTEIKITVKLDHGMPRDRDAIQSVFNRGMGRIYDLPDEFEGTADGQTQVDNYTATANETGTAAAIRGWLAGPSKLGGRSGPPVIKETANQGETSVWTRAPFAAVSPNESLVNANGDIARSAYRAVDWVALKSLK